jgi:hypothetical protein
VAFSVVSGIIGSKHDWPFPATLKTIVGAGHPTVRTLTLSQTASIANGLIAVVLAATVVVVCSILWAVVRAPYEQRDFLRDEVEKLTAERATLSESIYQSVRLTSLTFTNESRGRTDGTALSLDIKWETSSDQRVEMDQIEIEASIMKYGNPFPLARSYQGSFLFPPHGTASYHNVGIIMSPPLKGVAQVGQLRTRIRYGLAFALREFEQEETRTFTIDGFGTGQLTTKSFRTDIAERRLGDVPSDHD